MPTAWTKDLPACGCPAETIAGQAAIATAGFDPWNPAQADGVQLTCTYCTRTWAATAANLTALRELHARRVAQRTTRLPS